jgi:glutamine cyclotransferase
MKRDLRWLWLTGLALLITAAVYYFTALAPAALDACDVRAAAPPPESVTPVCTYTVAEVYPHDAEAFTQGLQYVDGALYEGTGRYGRSSLRRVALESGEVLEQVDLAEQHFGEGVTVLDGRVYQLTWNSNVGFVYDLATLELLQTFQYPTEGWGLTHDGVRLIMSDGSDWLYTLDPQTLAQTPLVAVTDETGPVRQLNVLEYIHGYVYANIWHSDRIARIDPQTGRVAAWLDLTGLRPPATVENSEAVLNGIAFDPGTGRLFVTGKLWPALFEIELRAQ